MNHIARSMASLALFAALAPPLAAQSESKGGRFERVRLTPPDQFCSYSGYSTSPESADGKLISYTKWYGKPTDSKWGKDGEIWVCDRDGTNHRKVADVRGDDVHNGAEVNWIDETFATAQRVQVGDERGAVVLNMKTGQVVHGPYPGGIQHESHDGVALLVVRKDTDDYKEGVYRLDTRDGSTQLLMSKRDLLPWKDKMKRGSSDPDDWGIAHLEWSPSGKYFAFVLFHNWKHGYQFFFTADGEFHAFFGGKLSHPNWYDDEHVFGGQGNNTPPTWTLCAFGTC